MWSDALKSILRLKDLPQKIAKILLREDLWMIEKFMIRGNSIQS